MTKQIKRKKFTTVLVHATKIDDVLIITKCLFFVKTFL